VRRVSEIVLVTGATVPSSRRVAPGHLPRFRV